MVEQSCAVNEKAQVTQVGQKSRKGRMIHTSNESVRRQCRYIKRTSVSFMSHVHELEHFASVTRAQSLQRARTSPHPPSHTPTRPRLRVCKVATLRNNVISGCQLSSGRRGRREMNKLTFRTAALLPPAVCSCQAGATPARWEARKHARTFLIRSTFFSPLSSLIEGRRHSGNVAGESERPF